MSDKIWRQSDEELRGTLAWEAKWRAERQQWLHDHAYGTLQSLLNRFAFLAAVVNKNDPLLRTHTGVNKAPVDMEVGEMEQCAAALWNTWHGMLAPGGVATRSGLLLLDDLLQGGHERLQRAQDRTRVQEHGLQRAENNPETPPEELRRQTESYEAAEAKCLMLAARTEALTFFVGLVYEGAVGAWEDVRPAAPAPQDVYSERLLDYFEGVLAIEGRDDLDDDGKGTDYFKKVADHSPGRAVSSQAVRNMFINWGVWVNGSKLRESRPGLEAKAREALQRAGRI